MYLSMPLAAGTKCEASVGKLAPPEMVDSEVVCILKRTTSSRSLLE